MIRTLIIVACLFSCVSLQAQVYTTVTKSEKKLFTTKIREKLRAVSKLKADTLKPALPDSISNQLNNKVDSLKSLKGKLDLTSKTDSLRSFGQDSLNRIAGKVHGLEQRIGAKGDSIKSIGTKVTSRINGLENKLQSTTDSLQDKVSSRVTKAEEKIQNVEKKATNILNDTQQKVSSKIDQVAGEKVNLPTSEIGQKLDLPNVDIPKASLPNVDAKISDLNMDQSSLKTDLTQLSEVNGGDLSKVSEQLKIPEMKTPALGEINKISEVGGEIKNIDDKLADAEVYEKELQKIKEGDLTKLDKLPEEAEKQITQIDQVKGLSQEMSKATQQQAQYEAMIQRYRDKKLLQEEIVRKASNVANEQLTKFAPEVQLAQGKLAKSKRMFSQIKSVKDIFKTRSDELVGKKFYERLVPGITTQAFNKEYFSMDVALQLGYRITPRLTTGFGATYRFAFDKDFDHFVRSEDIYGGRIYLDFAVRKGLFVHAEFEALKCKPQAKSTITVPQIPNEYAFKNVYQSYFGLGKRMNISRQIRGSVLALYRVEYSGDLPSMSKVVVRMGFDYMFGNKKRKFAPLRQPVKS